MKKLCNRFFLSFFLPSFPFLPSFLSFSSSSSFFFLLKQWTYVSHSSGGWEVQDQGASPCFFDFDKLLEERKPFINTYVNVELEKVAGFYF